jgi:hypothetical protein
MTKTPAAWRAAARRCQLNADNAEANAARYDALAGKCADLEDTLVGDVYFEASMRCSADADWWRDKAARFSAYADDAELPVTLTVVAS